MKKLFRKIAIIGTLSGMLFGLEGCAGDLLDTSPSYSFSSSNVWTSPILARAAVMGVYNELYEKFSKNYDSPSIGIPFDAWSSVMDIDMNWKNNCFVISGSCTPSNGNVGNHYKYYYTVVYRANDVINNIDNVPEMDDSEKARLKAECKFLRAWAYYHLNVLWRGVPIYMENVESSEATKARSSEAEVWEQVLSDLTDCINEPNLLGKYAQGNSSYGRITKGAAYAFRGYTYQFMGDYAKALADFEAIEGLGYALYSPSNGVKGNRDFFQLFKPANEQCDEMIFSVQCVETSGMGNPRGINYGNRCTGGSAWNNYLPNPAFVEMYECADGSEFDWEKYCPGWHSMTPQERVAFFLRDGLQSGKGEWGTTEATSNYQALYNNMVSYGADMSKYLDQGNEARIRQAYEDRDPRLMQSIITPYSTYDGNQAGVGNHTWTLRWPYILDAGEPYDIRTDTNSKFYYLWRKYVTENDECTTRWVYSEDIILCRYAEILLRRAECLNELGRTSEAVAFVNRIRQRVGHVLLNDQAYPATIVSGQEDMRQRIRKEFYVELGGEDSMFFNELRWGTWYDRKFKDHSSGQVGELNTNGLMQIWGETTYKHLSVGEQIKIDIRTDTNSKFYYLWRKYVTENDECTTRWVYSEDIILCRYAEILLRRAECLNELGRTSEAVAFVNRIRQRVGHVLLNDQAYPATIVSGQEDMRQRIRKEFYVELGGEDSMFFNELRWGTWYDRKFKDHSSGQVGELNTNGLMQIWGETTYKHLSVGEQIKIWPIPAKEREMNSNLTQNPGWQD